MKWIVTVLRKSGDVEWPVVADCDLAGYIAEIANAEGKAWVLDLERVADLGDSALVEPDGGELVQARGKRRWRIKGDVEEDWWVEVDAQGNELPGGWEYARDKGCVCCTLG